MVNKMHLLKAVAALSMAMVADMASAHVGYGTSLYDQATNTYAGSGSGGLNPTVSSNAGWISGLSNNGVNRTAAVDTLGDTHNNRFRFFTLTQQSQVSFTVKGTANSNGASVLNPGVSIFSGTVPASSHDGVGDTNGLSAAAIATMQTAAHNAYLANQPAFATWSPFFDAMDEITANGGGAVDAGGANWGVYKSDGNFTMGNNNGLVSGVSFLGAVADRASGAYADGTVDNTVSWTGILGPGTYSMVIGGTSLSDLVSLFAEVQNGVGNPNTAGGYTSCDYSNPVSCNGTAFSSAYANLRLARNMAITFNVQAVPVPGAVWLFGSALAGLVGLRRRQQLAA